MGDSIVIAGSSRKMRIHIHTDQPVDLFSFLGKQGTIIYQKVDDMVMQNEIASNRKANIGLLTDSTCDLPDYLLEKYQIQVVPLSVHLGDNYFLDRTTITPETFYDMLENSPVYPSTSQPTYKDFINKYSFLGTHYESLIALHLSKHMSGTFSNSERAALAVSEQSHKRISVVNSNRISSALGLAVLRAARAIEAGSTHDEVLSQMESWTAKNKIYVSTRSTKYLVKSGRLSQTKGIIGKLLNLKPIVFVTDEGKAGIIAKPFTEKASMARIMHEIERQMRSRKIWGYAISHIRNHEIADVYARKLEELTGKPAEFINHASPVLGVNGGPGIVVVSVMFE
jgi:DegV family protein with EDD domain